MFLCVRALAALLLIFCVSQAWAPLKDEGWRLKNTSEVVTRDGTSYDLTKQRDEMIKLGVDFVKKMTDAEAEGILPMLRAPGSTKPRSRSTKNLGCFSVTLLEGGNAHTVYLGDCSRKKIFFLSGELEGIDEMNPNYRVADENIACEEEDKCVIYQSPTADLKEVLENSKRRRENLRHLSQDVGQVFDKDIEKLSPLFSATLSEVVQKKKYGEVYQDMAPYMNDSERLFLRYVDNETVISDLCEQTLCKANMCDDEGDLVPGKSVDGIVCMLYTTNVTCVRCGPTLFAENQKGYGVFSKMLKEFERLLNVVPPSVLMVVAGNSELKVKQRGYTPGVSAEIDTPVCLNYPDQPHNPFFVQILKSPYAVKDGEELLQTPEEILARVSEERAQPDSSAPADVLQALCGSPPGQVSRGVCSDQHFQESSAGGLVMAQGRGTLTTGTASSFENSVIAVQRQASHAEHVMYFGGVSVTMKDKA